jgi:hypothetical protein
MAAAAVAALMAMSASAPVQAAGNNKSSDLEWMTASHVTSTSSAGLRSTYSRPTLLVVQSSCEWKAAMQALQATNSLAWGADAEPNVDWTRQAVVVVALGSVPYGYSLKVNETRELQGKLMVDVHVDYQSYENSLDDVSPAAVVVVNSHGNKVRALYDLALPGMPTQSDVANCSGSHSGPGLDGSAGSVDSGSSVALTWGALKSTYR